MRPSSAGAACGRSSRARATRWSAAFARASDAVAAALDAQRPCPTSSASRFARADGAAHRRGAAPRRGQLLRAHDHSLRAAAGVRHGGQVLCRVTPPPTSSSTVCPTAPRWRDLGAHRLKDLAPAGTGVAAGPSRPAGVRTFPPLRSLDAAAQPAGAADAVRSDASARSPRSRRLLERAAAGHADRDRRMRQDPPRG